MTHPVALAVEGLGIVSAEGRIVHGVSFALEAGQVLSLLGESGSGKSLLALALLGALPAGLRATGRISLQGESVAADEPLRRRAWWGRRIALLPQEPWLALDPTMRIDRQLRETHRHVRGLASAPAAAATRRDFAALGLGEAAARLPHQISGGMSQRAAFAIARAGGAPVLVVDEPTKGLDAAHKMQLVAALRETLAAGGSLLVITHDVEVARALGGRAAVMLEGRLIEEGDAGAVLGAPRHPYTRALVDAAPAAWPRVGPAPPGRAGALVLAARGLGKRFGPRLLFDGLDLQLRAGERLAVTGPSGSGKSTLGGLLLGLIPPDRGRVVRAPGLPKHAFQKLYQDPGSAFAPGVTLGRALRQLASRHALRRTELDRWMETLRLSTALLDRLPRDVSGGELQRFALLRVLALQPAFVFADEPSSRLDPVIQRQVIELLVASTAAAGAALLIVTHDAAIADRVADRRIDLPMRPPGRCAPGP